MEDILFFKILFFVLSSDISFFLNLVISKTPWGRQMPDSPHGAPEPVLYYVKYFDMLSCFRHSNLYTF
jgi:hypothetical protein